MAKDDFKHEIINIIGTISEGKKRLEERTNSHKLEWSGT